MSFYRNFASKDELVAEYLRNEEREGLLTEPDHPARPVTEKYKADMSPLLGFRAPGDRPRQS